MQQQSLWRKVSKSGGIIPISHKMLASLSQLVYTHMYFNLVPHLHVPLWACYPVRARGEGLLDCRGICPLENLKKIVSLREMALVCLLSSPWGTQTRLSCKLFLSLWKLMKTYFFGKKSADISCSLAPRVFLYSQIQLRFGNSCDFYVSLIFLCV